MRGTQILSPSAAWNGLVPFVIGIVLGMVAFGGSKVWKAWYKIIEA